ncbi:MAG TPA: hypothetical protein VGM64_09855 [Lacunisphaera sp.]
MPQPLASGLPADLSRSVEKRWSISQNLVTANGSIPMERALFSLCNHDERCETEPGLDLLRSIAIS